ncbi:DMT family transporter [Ramlibacter sp. 2FC]|uniref:DMT family transporter n=1 Tax=Ramlibacter sp. 2FC TaxID=2502188 RepID=UPI00201E4794|nr:DMT family transporter [Ramlibacter sp. 2FC]
MSPRDLFAGVAYALAAGLMWGLVFVAPALLPDYPPPALAFGRYLAFGLVALLLALPDRARLAALTRADWAEAFKLSLVGNILYYLFLSAGIQAAGVPLASVIIGALPVVIAVCANWHERALPWARLAPSLGLIAAGIALVNRSEMARVEAGGAGAYSLGAALTGVAVAAWTWYPIRNARWLQRHPALSATAWTTAQGLATLPLAALGWIGYLLWPGEGAFAASGWAGLGPRPGLFLLLMLAMGLFASWLGTLAWSRASQRLPTSLSGQLIVFETLAALAYGFWHRGQGPDLGTGAGIALLVAGVVLGVRAFQRQTTA